MSQACAARRCSHMRVIHSMQIHSPSSFPVLSGRRIPGPRSGRSKLAGLRPSDVGLMGAALLWANVSCQRSRPFPRAVGQQFMSRGAVIASCSPVGGQTATPCF
eukprot:10256271-Alexandrium_andersonii.AAC.1